MATWVTAIGGLLLVLSVAGLAAPGWFTARVSGWRGPGLLVFAVGVRLAIAALLWFAADTCRHPTAVRVLAVLAAVAGLAALAMGSQRLARLVAWWVAQPAAVQRLGFGLTGAMGTFLLYTTL